MSQRKRPKIVYIEQPEERQPAPKERELRKPDPKPVQEQVEQAPLEVSEAPPQVPKRKKPSWVLLMLLAFIASTVLVAFIFIPVKAPVEKQPEAPKEKVIQANCLKVLVDIPWAPDLPDMSCAKGALEEGQSIADVLLGKNIDYKLVIQVLEAARSEGYPEIRPGDHYHLLYKSPELDRPAICVLEPAMSGFVFLDLSGEPNVFFHPRNALKTERKQLDVVIQTSLADAMFNRESGLKLTRSLESAVKYKIDLFHLDPGDRFQMLYNETLFEGNKAEIGDLLAVRYRHLGREGYAFAFQGPDGIGFYDFEGKALESGFLMAPLEYGRISSSYNLQRPDPLSNSGKIMPHLGTDYAAPEGTPIMAVGDGLVTHAEFKGGNGNYVKITHSEEIQTQYLHMSAFADGISPGVSVRQGQVIGYVGSTGRSTGPHVCFRYWKNGAQVDHRKEENFGVAQRLDGMYLEEFELKRDTLLNLMTDL